MIELARQTQPKSFQRVDVPELERLLRLTKDERTVKHRFLVMVKKVFKRR
jgi:hypothetical protein